MKRIVNGGLMALYKRIAATFIALVMILATSLINIAASTQYLLPDGLGSLHTYTLWDKIDWHSDCRKLKNFMQEKDAISNNHGIVTYGDFYCGALTSVFGKVGDILIVIQEDNVVYPVIMADTKNQRDSTCNKWGHQYGKCIVEFEILSSHRKDLYNGSGGYISEKLSKPIAKILNVGSIYDNANYLWNLEQLCLDNGLEGYQLLKNPYGSELIEPATVEQTSEEEQEPRKHYLPTESVMHINETYYYYVDIKHAYEALWDILSLMNE